MKPSQLFDLSPIKFSSHVPFATFHLGCPQKVSFSVWDLHLTSSMKCRQDTFSQFRIWPFKTKDHGFRVGLVSKARRLLHHSTLGSGVIKTRKEKSMRGGEAETGSGSCGPVLAIRDQGAWESESDQEALQSGREGTSTGSGSCGRGAS